MKKGKREFGGGDIRGKRNWVRKKEFKKEGWRGS